MDRSGKKPRFDHPGVSARRGQIQVKIEDLNENDAGVVFYQKYKLNVEKTLPGEKVLVEYQPSRSHKDRFHLIQVFVNLFWFCDILQGRIPPFKVI